MSYYDERTWVRRMHRSPTGDEFRAMLDLRQAEHDRLQQIEKDKLEEELLDDVCPFCSYKIEVCHCEEE